ncbi:hypothetical protein NKI12_08030 [Mesorhizobium australicum]|uniref:Uncharacterized protein n=1 Tax=Mesorhizobium australicum TaxID=536018 RepID=A0ACC6SU07_9HYPH
MPNTHVLAAGEAMPAATTPKIEYLPFIGLREKGEPGEISRHFWRVQPTGDYRLDCQTGTKAALQYLAYEEADRGGGGILQHIVSDMPRALTGIEVGFLQMVAFAASAGAYRAREIDAYWTRCEAGKKGGVS